MKFLRVFILPAIILAAFGNGLIAQDNAIDKYFKQYVDDDRFTVIYISSKMFQLFEKLDINELEMEDEESRIFMEVAKDMRGLRILTSEENVQGFYQEAKNKINTTEYEPLITVRSKTEDNVEFLIKEEGDKITELLLLAGGHDSFVLLSFIGSFDLEKVTKMAKEIEKENKVKKQD